MVMKTGFQVLIVVLFAWMALQVISTWDDRHVGWNVAYIAFSGWALWLTVSEWRYALRKPTPKRGEKGREKYVHVHYCRGCDKERICTCASRAYEILCVMCIPIGGRS